MFNNIIYNDIRNVRVYLKCNGIEKYVIGSYHPNVETIYIEEGKLERSLKRFGFDIANTVPFDKIAKVKILCKDGMTRIWG